MNAQGPSGREPVHGVLLLDKPRGCTSQQALQQARRALGAAKAGHTGTLDPLAEGLLPLCFGAATKFAQSHLEADKAYVAQLRLGVSTSTCDGEGEVLRRAPVPSLDAAALRGVLERFVGDILQVPPMHSALKRDGRPLYEYARAGQQLELDARPVRIDSIELLGLEQDLLSIEVRCGKGTYIRSLARDIGDALGCGAHLAGLRRTRSGGFDLAQARPLEQVREAAREQARAWLLPVDALLRELPSLELEPAQAAALLQGRAVVPPAEQCPAQAAQLRIYGAGGHAATPVFLGVARWDGRELSVQRLLSPEELRTQPQ
ncbi:MAG: tRNA pseudouridine(55) synthase TruB [Betaproteobacteria bacterium]|nr:tRNA pseudouridine(55) synthase TruB [Betaproteobacteria bacterium]MDE1957274.1 tRNA pseudouridine(55) synthase TruB [Betaproteobacteria bacterium]MDE2153650.1 tRNA pseudouridine(55) synthase TruB [Betaproteobacteria bacterium]